MKDSNLREFAERIEYEIKDDAAYEMSGNEFKKQLIGILTYCDELMDHKLRMMEFVQDLRRK